jgi:uncharacterized protein
MTKKQELQSALTSAMKARDEDTKRTLRLVMTSIKLAEVDQRAEIDDARVIGILQKEIKTRQDSIEEAKRANRPELIDAAEREMDILNRFLPQQISEEELAALARAIIEDIGPADVQSMGEVMKQLMPKLAGRASGQDASRIVKALLLNNQN